MNNTVTKDLILSKIDEVHYTSVPGTTTTICSLVLENGFVVTGSSACVDPDNFNRETGEEIAFGSAIDKVWALEGYLLKERLFQEEQNNECPACNASAKEEERPSEVHVRIISLDDLMEAINHKGKTH